MHGFMENYTLVIILALVGFVGLAALLLVPVYRFLKREERTAERWTEQVLRSPLDLNRPPPADGIVRQPDETSDDAQATRV